MSINMDSDGPTDYADFEYQQADFQVTSANDGTGDGNVAGLGEFEPLGSIGGLDTNEVAELVYLETYAGLEEEPETGSSPPDFVELRGTVGANLSATTASGISTTSGPPTQNTNMDITADEGYSDLEVDNTDPAASRILGRETTRDEIFQVFRTATAGATQGGGGDHFYAVKNWRALTGRGPVIDNNDNMGIYGALIPAEGTDQQIRGNVRLHMVWDTAETSDAGRQFSVPR